MTETQKLNTRIAAIDGAIAQVRVAMNVDRKLGNAKSSSGHFTRALTELVSVETQLRSLLARTQTTDK
jgi:hypothetical protein